MLRLDLLRSLVDVYPGVDAEDEMVAAFDFCLHGKGGAGPVDRHGDAFALVLDAADVDHLHPDSGIALATAADGEELTREGVRRPGGLGSARRPGFQLGLDIAAVKAANPQAILGPHPRWSRHHRLGGTSVEAEAEFAGDHPHRGAVPRRPWDGGAVRPGRPGVRATARCGAEGEGSGDFPDDPRGWRRWTGRRSATTPTPTAVLDFLAREKLAQLAELGMLVRQAFPALQEATKQVVDLPSSASVEEVIARLKELHPAYRDDYQADHDRNVTPDSPAI